MPWTSILPSVDTSRDADDSRTARASLSTGSHPPLCIHQRPQPQAGRDEARPGGRVPLVQRQPPLGFKMLAHFRSGERREGQRLQVRPRSGLPDSGQRHAARCRQHGTADQAADAPLIGRHAVRGVALHVLDVLVALPGAEPHIRGGDIVLQIDERLTSTGNFPDRDDRGARQIHGQVGAGESFRLLPKFRAMPARRHAVSAAAASPKLPRAAPTTYPLAESSADVKAAMADATQALAPSWLASAMGANASRDRRHRRRRASTAPVAHPRPAARSTPGVR